MSMLNDLKHSDRILVLSPHLDDAVLSVGGIMEYASHRGRKVVAASICTSEAPVSVSSSPAVREKHEKWGLGPYPFSVRCAEDIEAVHALGAYYLHGGKLDAIYRTDSDGTLIYPSPTSRFSDLSPADPLPSSLVGLLEEWIAIIAPTIILCPLGVGQHVDHVITSQALKRVTTIDRISVFLYEDMPYSAGYYGSRDTVKDAINRTEWAVGLPVIVPVDVDAKLAAVKKYGSQLASIFPEGHDAESELKGYMAGLIESRYQERVWRAHL